MTRMEQPRPPWEWRNHFRAGAPRTCLTSHRDPVYVRRGEHVYKVGQFDWLLRLYQHVGVSEQSVRWEGYVLYDLDCEMPVIRLSSDWLEYVDNRREIVFRISKKDALAAGGEIETPDGVRFAVPLSAYSSHEGQ
ncbi:hypothetical protein [Streptomyces sp. BK022]|uniref:hypothetical protein n=1 Tax=Streptomyces sp. BK022 TaxID=2512123 RepID=UPI00102A2136|nr:hypothetical protein [Streptomyces sp. BK022]